MNTRHKLERNDGEVLSAMLMGNGSVVITIFGIHGMDNAGKKDELRMSQEEAAVFLMHHPIGDKVWTQMVVEVGNVEGEEKT